MVKLNSLWMRYEAIFTGMKKTDSLNSEHRADVVNIIDNTSWELLTKESFSLRYFAFQN